jgi:hypothetical protein
MIIILVPCFLVIALIASIKHIERPIQPEEV